MRIRIGRPQKLNSNAMLDDISKTSNTTIISSEMPAHEALTWINCVSPTSS